MAKVSETTTENIFRSFYGCETFIEKSAIPKEYGFKSKSGTDLSGFPDFFRDEEEYCIVVEAKANNQASAIVEVNFYMSENAINKDILGIAISGQKNNELEVNYFYKIYKKNGGSEIVKILNTTDNLLSIKDIHKLLKKEKYGEMITTEHLISVLKELNNRFHKDGKVRDTDRSLFFSGLMIALNNNNFRQTYKNTSAPSKEEVSTTNEVVLEAYYLNEAIIRAISSQLKSKINNLSKKFSWEDKFSFIKNIDYSLIQYKEIIKLIEEKIFYPFKNDEKQDILGRAYKIFLSRAGKAENKNIILTPDHIKELMIKLADLTQDDVVLDTCTGSGGFLMESMETMIKLTNGNQEKIKNIKEKQLIGFETDSVLFALACSNMFLHGDGKTNLLYRSSLLDETQGSIINSNDEQLLKYIKSLKPTKIVINPPYENNNAIKFTKQALDYLEPNGKLIIIMPTPTLTKNQKDFTKKILKIARLDCVIKMPFKLFSEQKRTVNTAIFGFTKTPHKENGSVLFYNLDDDGFVSIQHKGRVDKNNKWSKIESQIINTVLTPIDVQNICERKKIFKDGLINCSGFQPIENNKSGYELVQIKDLFDIKKGTLASEDCEDDGEYNFITASEEWKKHTLYSHDTEAIVYAVSAAGSLGRSHYVSGQFIASNLCLVLTLKESKYEINIQFYSYYLESLRKIIVSDLADGTSKLTISKDDLAEYYIEYIPKEKQDNFVEQNVKNLLKLKAQIETAENKLKASLQNLL